MLIKIIKFAIKIVKYMLLLPLFCSSHSKYDGENFEDWINK